MLLAPLLLTLAVTTGPPPKGAAQAGIGGAAGSAVAALAVVAIWNSGIDDGEVYAFSLIPTVYALAGVGAGIGQADGDGTFLSGSIGGLVGSLLGSVVGVVLGFGFAVVEFDSTGGDVDLRGPIVGLLGGAVAGGGLGGWAGAATNE